MENEEREFRSLESRPLDLFEIARTTLVALFLAGCVVLEAPPFLLVGCGIAFVVHLAGLLPIGRRKLPDWWPAAVWLTDLSAILAVARVTSTSISDHLVLDLARALILIVAAGASASLGLKFVGPLGLVSGLAWAGLPELIHGSPPEPTFGLLITGAPVVVSAVAVTLGADPYRRMHAEAKMAKTKLLEQLERLDQTVAGLGKLETLAPASLEGLRMIGELCRTEQIGLLLYDPPGSARGLAELAKLHVLDRGANRVYSVHAPQEQRLDLSLLGCGMPDGIDFASDRQIVSLSTTSAPIGKLIVAKSLDGRQQIQEDVVGSVGKLVRLLLEREQMTDRLSSSFLATIESLVVSLEAKDPYTQGHSVRVTDYAVRIAQELGLEGELLEEIRVGGMLHDIGKISIPEAILHKPGRLTEEEMAVIQEHPRTGARIIDSFNTSSNVLAFVLYHHERYDGKGYPFGIAGAEIPLPARIGKVADSFDAMTSQRPYGSPKTFAEAAEILRVDSETHFDPAIVNAFLNVLQRDGRMLERRLRRSEGVEAPSRVAEPLLPPAERTREPAAAGVEFSRLFTLKPSAASEPVVVN